MKSNCMIQKQIELEKKMTQLSIDSYQHELYQAKEKDNFSNTRPTTIIFAAIKATFSVSNLEITEAAIVFFIAFPFLYSSK